MDNYRKYSPGPNRASNVNYGTSQIKHSNHVLVTDRHTKRKKPVFKIILILLAVLVVISLSIAIFFTACSKTLPQGQTVEVTIDEGSSTLQIADKMADSGVVGNKFIFIATVTEMGAESSLKSGTYVFEGGKSVRDYVEILCSGVQSTSPQLLVKEGMKISDIAKELEKVTKSRINSEQFIDATSNASKYVNKYDFLKSAGNNSLEGFLYPKTYSISSSDSPEDIICMMLDQFSKETKNLDLSYASSKNFSLYDVVTLASIIEKESTSDVRYKVSSVFYNRLKAGMYLNSDATTAYEVGHDPTSQEVHANTPYSTYSNYGLPPTPICSPGYESLNAACHPEETDYLYFAFAKDQNGQYQYKFSTNFDDHQQALIDLGIVY